MESFKKGQTVYLLRVGDYRDRDHKIHEPREAMITVVGRKYLTVAFPGSRFVWELKFDKEYPFRQKTDYAPDEMIFFSREDAINAQNKRNVFLEVRKEISARHIKSFTLNQLQKIKSIMNEKVTDDRLPDEW